MGPQSLMFNQGSSCGERNKTVFIWYNKVIIVTVEEMQHSQVVYSTGFKFWRFLIQIPTPSTHYNNLSNHLVVTSSNP